MKNLKKFVALLLAGVMAMVMLTACSGGVSGTTDKPKEDKLMQQIMNSSQGKGIKENDPDLYRTTLTDLDTEIKTQNKKGGSFKLDFKATGITPAEEYVTITVFADYKVGQFLMNLLDFISTNIGIKYPGANVDVKANSSWTKAAVVVKSNEYGSYVAVAIQIKNLNYPKT